MSLTNNDTNTEISIYEYIKLHCTDGRLPDNFSLPNPAQTDGGLKFADGAFDGMTIYHMTSKQPDENAKLQINQILKLISAGEYEKADDALITFSKEYRALSAIDEFEGCIIDNVSTLNAQNLHQYALKTVLESTDAECVKYGMEILEVFTEPSENIKEIIRLLGLSNEFALFAIFIMQRWSNGNEEIFQLAQKVHGWGRIHAVERLNPETEEIKKWLLHEGVNNHVVPDYSALDCYTKADVRELLRNPAPLSQEDFYGISHIVDALLSEGPVSGISAIEDSHEMISDYLSKAKEHTLTLNIYETIKYIHEWSKDSELEQKCLEILKSETCENIVKAALLTGNGIELAKFLNLECKETLYNCLLNDFDNNYHNCRHLLNDEDYTEKVLTLFREKLPLNEMASEPQNEKGFGEEFSNYHKLMFCLQELDSKPLTGTEFVIAGLKSPVINNRNRALTVLKAWIAARSCKLQDLSTDLYNEVISLKSKEVNEGVMKNIEELLINC